MQKRWYSNGEIWMAFAYKSINAVHVEEADRHMRAEHVAAALRE